MPTLYRNESSDPKSNAQRNLCGRTHYVDDDTLRFHKSRVISARHACNGLLFTLITSDSLNYEGTKRGFRYVVFDLFGTVIARVELEHAFKTSDKAHAAMTECLKGIDAPACALAAIEAQEKSFAAEMADLRSKIADQCAP